jgi:hypothetical protein
VRKDQVCNPFAQIEHFVRKSLTPFTTLTDAVEQGHSLQATSAEPQGGKAYAAGLTTLFILLISEIYAFIIKLYLQKKEKISIFAVANTKKLTI